MCWPMRGGAFLSYVPERRDFVSGEDARMEKL